MLSVRRSGRAGAPGLQRAWRVRQLSQQQIIDCDAQSFGCEGGFSDPAFDYARRTPISAFSNYPYKAARTVCKDTVGLDFTIKWQAKATPYVSFHVKRALKATKYEVIATVMVSASESMMHLPSSDDVYDAKASGECGMMVDHSVAMYKAFEVTAEQLS